MNNICDLGVKTIAHYLLILNKCLFEAALNWKALIVICLLLEALCTILKREAVRPQGHTGSHSRGSAVPGLPG